jgi:hypothetical protein
MHAAFIKWEQYIYIYMDVAGSDSQTCFSSVEADGVPSPERKVRSLSGYLYVTGMYVCSSVAYFTFEIFHKILGEMSHKIASWNR